MNRIKTSNPRRLVVFGIILIIALVVLLIWARDIIREVIVLPVSYLLWTVKVLLYMTPETYFWMGAVAIGMLIAWRAINGRPPATKNQGQSGLGAIDRVVLTSLEARSRQVGAQPSFADRQALGNPPVTAPVEAPVRVNRGRVAFWHNKIILVRQGASAYYMSMFHVTLALLLLEMLAHRFRLTPSQVEERLRLDPESEKGRLMGLKVPDYVREYVLSRMRYHDLETKSFWTILRENIEDFFHNLSRSLSVLLNGSGRVTGVQPLDPRVERIIKYMEEELEVPNDDHGR